jgi:hypothetical protein
MALAVGLSIAFPKYRWFFFAAAAACALERVAENAHYLSEVIAGGLLAALLAAVVGTAMPTTYRASAGVMVPAVDGAAGIEGVRFERERLQRALTLGVSGAYAQELIEQAGLDLSTDEVQERLDATRPRMGFYIEITFSDTDRSNVEAVMPYLIPSLDAVFSQTQEASLGSTEDELRPVVPGE